MMMNKMRDPVCDHTCFAATCAGEDQQRTFDVRSRVALLGVQTCKEIHQMSSSEVTFILPNGGKQVSR